MPAMWLVCATMLLVVACDRAPLDMTPTVGERGGLDPAPLMTAARQIQVVDEGGDQACLIDMRYRAGDREHRHRTCLQVTPGDDAPDVALLRTACGRMATINIALMRASEAFEPRSTHLRLRRHCPPGQQFRCESLEGSALTLFGYDQPGDELAHAQAGCTALGGLWRAG